MTCALDRRPLSASEIEEAAGDWLMRVDRDGSPEMRRALSVWLAATPRHRAAFLRLSYLWRRAEALRRLRDPDDVADPDLLAPLTDTSIVTAHSPLEQRSPTRALWARVQGWRAVVIAATLLTALLVIGSWLLFDASHEVSYATQIGAFSRVLLADGSTVELNTQSEIRVRYTRHHRVVKLVRGEALFIVVHDASRPFDVVANDITVRAVGTSFSVRLRPGHSIDVLVAQGSVVVGPPNGPTVPVGHTALILPASLSAGATTATATAPVTVEIDDPGVADIQRRLVWTEGSISFNGDTLANAVAEFNRYNRRQLVIADPAIRGHRIGGRFSATDPAGFALALERMNVPATIRLDARQPNVILLEGAPR